MAKEMMIIFVYDTQLVNREEDDPAKAIIYFHPGWVSDQQRTALCGQIMGTTHFLKSVFTCPKVISLQSGKFSIREYGRYILAVGTDRNIPDWVLEFRADTLSSLITFFHNDLQIMAELYQSNENFSAKLYHMFETYLKILTYSSNLFSNIPKIQLPKSASNVFLEATQILQCCQEVDQVLGGTMLYHNKVVATQLSSNLTKRIVLTDPYRIKSPAETVDVDFQLPLGVQLLQVYIDGKDYQDLLEDATRCRTVHQYLNKKSYIKKNTLIKEPVITAMKRDQSLLFTMVPEEDPDAQSPINIENNIIPAKTLTRPKFLNLRNKTTDLKSEPIKAATEFHGQTSICSTPMTNKVLHQSIMSICTNPENLEDSDKSESLNSVLSEAEKSPLKKSSSLPDIVSNETEQKANSECTTDEWKSVENIEPAEIILTAKVPRKSLTLPLKSLSMDGDNVFSPVGRNKNYPGVQLTPLMSKLSLLAMEERSSGFCSHETTPSEFKDYRFTQSYPILRPESKFKKTIQDRLKKGVLFVCGQQDMVVALLLEENACNSPDIVKNLWEMCVESLGRLEKQLRHCLETYPGGNVQNENGEPYSYLSMDQHWDTVQRGGPWGGMELGALTHLHRDFANTSNLTEILLRDDDSIIYGHHCGKTEVYYLQSANSNAGLPTPADPMGAVPLKAKRRLERDHAIILL